MANRKQILLAIDDFDAAHPLLKYAANLAGGRHDYKIHLFHALQPMPPRLLESPGAEDPREETRVENKQERQQEGWVDRAIQEVKPLVESSKSQLAAARVPPEEIESHIQPLYRRDDLVEEIIKAARRYDCGTIVVGYTAYSWIREQFHTHISEKLRAADEGFEVCIVR